jgi:hypothetical protein
VKDKMSLIYAISGALDAPRHLFMPAEGRSREATIISFEAQRAQTPDGVTLVAMPASLVDQEMLGAQSNFAKAPAPGPTKLSTLLAAS